MQVPVLPEQLDTGTPHHRYSMPLKTWQSDLYADCGAAHPVLQWQAIAGRRSDTPAGTYRDPCRRVTSR
jgi:hypothetical protein